MAWMYLKVMAPEMKCDNKMNMKSVSFEFPVAETYTFIYSFLFSDF